jgi:hypothetical protein
MFLGGERFSGSGGILGGNVLGILGKDPREMFSGRNPRGKVLVLGERFSEF